MTKRYRVIALMHGQLTRLVVSDELDPYSTSELLAAEKVLREVAALSPAYVAPRIEEFDLNTTRSPQGSETP